MSFFGELKRRNVFRIAAFYVVSCWVILQVAALLFAAFELSQAWVRAVLAVLVLGFPLAVALAWFYEITPDGLRRTSELDGRGPRPHSAGRRLGVLTAALLVIAITLVAFDRLMPDSLEAGRASTERPADLDAARPADTIADRSIAVLPFVNRSAREDDVFLVDGIHDDILTQLAHIGSLTVISRTSVEKFRHTEENIRDIGAALGVAHILEGSVQRAGERIRVNVQLIAVSNDAHVWADIYDRELTTENIFAIQSDIATAIAGALEAALSPEEKAQLEDVPTQNLSALEAYFRGRAMIERRTGEAIRAAEQHFRRAIELDPEFAPAYVGLADAYMLQIAYGDAPLQAQKSLAKPLVEKALTLNPRLGEAYISLATVTDDPKQQEALYRQGIELAPGYASGYHWYGDFLGRQGRNEEALEQFRAALRVDPLSEVAAAKIGIALEGLGRFDEAQSAYESVVTRNPGFALGHGLLADFIWQAAGRLDTAVVHFEQAAALDPDNPQYPGQLGILWADLGDLRKADHWVDVARSIPGSGYFAENAIVYRKAGEGDFAGAAAHAKTLLAEEPDMPTGLWVSALHDLQEGRARQAVARYEAIYPSFRDGVAEVDNVNYFVAVDFAYVLQTIGENDRAERLLAASLQQLASQPRLGYTGYWISDARIYALQGKSAEALDALRAAVDEGWRYFWRAYLLHDPVFNELREQPAFAAIVTGLEADMAMQRERAGELTRAGEVLSGASE